MVQRITILLVLFMALFGGLVARIGLSGYFSIITEILIYIFLIFSIFARSGKGFPKPHLWHLIALFIFVTIISILINETSAARSIVSLRLLLRFYFFYLALTLMEPDDDLIKKINWFIVVLLVMQFPVVAVKFMKYGISERTAGAYALHDGSIATTLPISFIFYLASFYLLFKPKIIYILIGVGYLICSVVGAKRAIFFLYPFQFLAIYYYIYAKGTGSTFTKKATVFIFVIFVTMVVSTSILYFNKTLNPTNEVGGEIDPSFAFEYAERYNSGIDGYGYSFGRISTTQRVFEILWDSGFGQVVFGIGPGSTIPSLFDTKKERKLFKERYEQFRIKYGWTTINRIALEYGLAGVFIFSSILISFTVLCIKLYKKETDPYWKAFSTGSVFFSISMLFFAFAYHYTTFWGDTMSALYFYSMAVVHTRYHHRQLSNNELLGPQIAQKINQPITI